MTRKTGTLRIDWAFATSAWAHEFANGRACYVLILEPPNGRAGKAIAGHVDIGTIAEVATISGLPWAVAQSDRVKAELVKVGA